MHIQKHSFRTLAAITVACGLCLSAHAQLGSGWTSTTETFVVQTSAGCTATANSSGGGTFSVPSGAGRAEFRFQNLSSSVTEQFQGDITVNSLGGDRINVKQTFGPAPSTPWNIIAVTKANGGEFIEIEGGAVLASYTVGTTARFNTIYDPSAQTVDVYINGVHVEQKSGHSGPNYNKIGAYVSQSGTGPATVTWQNIKFWTGGTKPGSGGGTTFTISASAGSNGSISPSGSVKVNQGASQTFSINPNSGYTVSGVTVDGASVGAVTSYTFSNVQAGHSISATFTSSSTTQFTVSASAGSNGSISPSGSVKVNQGASQTFTVTPNSGFTVSSVTVDGSSVGAITSYTFSNVQANHTISATFTSSGGGTVAAPTFSNPGGTYTGEVHVRIKTTTSGASMRYTTDGSTPTETHGTIVPNNTIIIKTTSTLKAIAYLNGSDSSITSATYTIK